MIPIIAINAISGQTLDITLPFRLSSSLTYSVCGMDRSSMVTVSWTITDASTSEVVSVSGKENKLTGQTVSLRANTFSVEGRSLIFTAVAKIDSVSSSSSVTVITSLPPPSLIFIGGSSRSVSAASSPNLFVQVGSDPQTIIVAGLWSCATVAGAPCPSNISTAVARVTKNQLFLPRSVEPGTYLMSFTFKNVTVSQELIILRGNVPTVDIVRSVSTSDRLALFASVRNSEDCSIAWQLNGTAVAKTFLVETDKLTRALLVINISKLEAGCEHTFSVKASCDGSLSANATYVFVPNERPTVSCTISSNDASTTTVTALVTSLRVSATLSGASSDASYMFKFGYYDDENDKTAFPLVSSAQSLASCDFIAPRPTTRLQRRNVKFFAAALLNEEDVAVGRCSIEITILSSNASSALISGQTTMMQDAVRNNDTTSVLRTAASLAAVANSDDDKERKNKLKTDVVVAMVETVRNSTQHFSTEQRSATINTLRALVVSINTNDTVASKNSDAVVAIVEKAVSRDSNVTQTSFDAKKDSSAALEILSTLNMTATVAEVSTMVALSFASSVSLGEKGFVNSSQLAVSATSLPADQIGGSNLTTASGSSTIVLPTNLPVFENSTISSVVSIAATEYAKNPYGTDGLASGSNITSTVVDFTLVQDGVESTVTDLSDPISIKIAVTGNVTDPSALECVYFNTDNQTWDTTNVTTGVYDASSKTVTCQTTHLSTFAAVSTAPTAPAASAGSSMLGGGPIAAIVIGCIAVAALLAFGMLKKKQQQQPAPLPKSEEDVVLQEYFLPIEAAQHRDDTL
jgi:hypothetical protein